jgi:small ligand-binding sensory domain FIST
LGTRVPIIGAGVLGDYGFGPTTQFCGASVEHQHAVGAFLSGEITPYFRIMHGCVPMDGSYHTITRINGPEIYELDGHPIVPLIDAMYGAQEWQKQMPVQRLSIGVNMGERYGDFQEEQYVNRLITGVLPEQKGIVIFEPDLEEGMEIQFMLRDSDAMITSARENSAALMEQIITTGSKPGFGFYIDCAGRSAGFSKTLTEEASEVIEVCNQYHIPLLGFYSGVEVAPLLGKSRGLDWTGVLLVIAEE